MRRQTVIGNWKLHGDQLFVTELLQALAEGWLGVHKAEVVTCPALVHLDMAYTALANSNIGLGAQNVSRFSDGAYTGDVSAEMLHDLGCQYVIVGHSERRRYHGETDEVVAKKFMAAQKARVVPVLCVGESAKARELGRAIDVVERQIRIVAKHCGLEQLSRSVIAYEPLWAKNSDENATPEQVQEIHEFIRSELGASGEQTRIVYGGSVTPFNAQAFFSMPDIDGALVSGASLNAKEFLEICRAAE